MKRKLLLLLFMTATFSYAQFVDNAPWMKELKKKNKSNTAKSENKDYTIYKSTDSG